MSDTKDKKNLASYMSIKNRYIKMLESEGVDISNLSFKWYSYFKEPKPEINNKDDITYYAMKAKIYDKHFELVQFRNVYINMLNTGAIKTANPLKMVKYNVIYCKAENKYMIDPLIKQEEQNNIIKVREKKKSDTLERNKAKKPIKAMNEVLKYNSLLTAV
jgi:hypothetical protein